MGKIKIIFICAEALMGILLQAITDPPLWVSITAATVLIVIMIVTWFWPINLKSFGSKYISLPDACRKIYSLCEKLKEISPKYGLINVLDGEVLNGHDLRYHHIASGLIKDTQLYGKRTKSDTRIKITMDDMGHVGNIDDDCTQITSTLGKVLFVDLEVNKHDVNKILKEMKKDAKESGQKHP